MRNKHIKQNKMQNKLMSSEIDKTIIVQDNTTTVELSDAEIENLIFMYQEEKLAMDVYDYFYDTYNAKIFDNISNSESKHMSAVEDILINSNINITDYQSLDAGLFIDDSLQELYDNLISKGSQSLTDALEVGILIEEVDIEDLINTIENEDYSVIIDNVYENLLNGSENHV